MFNTIVLGYDGSVHASRAAAAASELGQRFASRVFIVTAFDPIHRYLGDEQRDAAAAKATSEAEEMAGVAARELAQHDVDATVEALEGPAADALLRVAGAQGADLVVLGSRGRGDLAAAVLGSTSHKVLNHAPCPVLIVP